MNTRSVLAIVVVAFASSGVAAAQAPKLDACALLTPAQVGTAVGAPVVVSLGQGTQACQWKSTTRGPNAVTASLSFISMVGFDAAKKSFGPITSTPVAGLGEDAYYSTMGRPDTTTLRVKKGTSAFTVRVFGGGISDDNAMKKEKAVAQAVLAKL